MIIGLEITTGKTATVELHARLDNDGQWSKFETVTLTDAQFVKSYDVAPLLGWKVTAIDAATTVSVWASYDD